MEVTPGRQPGRDEKERTRFVAPMVTYMCVKPAGGRGHHTNRSTPGPWRDFKQTKRLPPGHQASLVPGAWYVHTAQLVRYPDSGTLGLGLCIRLCVTGARVSETPSQDTQRVYQVPVNGYQVPGKRYLPQKLWYPGTWTKGQELRTNYQEYDTK